MCVVCITWLPVPLSGRYFLGPNGRPSIYMHGVDYQHLAWDLPVRDYNGNAGECFRTTFHEIVSMISNAA